MGSGGSSDGCSAQPEAALYKASHTDQSGSCVLTASWEKPYCTVRPRAHFARGDRSTVGVPGKHHCSSLLTHHTAVYAVCALDGGRLLSAGDDGIVREWDTAPDEDPVELRQVAGHGLAVRSLAVAIGEHSDRELCCIVSGSDDGRNLLLHLIVLTSAPQARRTYGICILVS